MFVTCDKLKIRFLETSGLLLAMEDLPAVGDSSDVKPLDMEDQVQLLMFLSFVSAISQVCTSDKLPTLCGSIVLCDLGMEVHRSHLTAGYED